MENICSRCHSKSLYKSHGEIRCLSCSRPVVEKKVRTRGFVAAQTPVYRKSILTKPAWRTSDKTRKRKVKQEVQEFEVGKIYKFGEKI